MIENSKLALKDGDPFYDRWIFSIATKFCRNETLNSSFDSSINDHLLCEGSLSIFGNCGNDSVLASQASAQGDFREVEFVEIYSNWGLKRGFCSAEYRDFEPGREETPDDVWTKISSCLSLLFQSGVYLTLRLAHRSM